MAIAFAIALCETPLVLPQPCSAIPRTVSHGDTMSQVFFSLVTGRIRKTLEFGLGSLPNVSACLSEERFPSLPFPSASPPCRSVSRPVTHSLATVHQVARAVVCRLGSRQRIPLLFSRSPFAAQHVLSLFPVCDAVVPYLSIY